MKNRKYRYFVGDFETTVYPGQLKTEVWASALVELYSEDVKVFGCIADTLNYLISLNDNIIVYYHNLKFDGSFWLDYLLVQLKYKQAYYQVDETTLEWLNDSAMPSKSIKYTISDMGQWYSIKVKTGKHIIEFRDSLKLLPFSVERIGKSFKTKHTKLSIDYKGFRYANCPITDEEEEYIKNDVLVIKEALEVTFSEGHTKLTIGSCCLAEFKQIIGRKVYNELFPDLLEYEIDNNYGANTADEYIRKSYRGGWCYLVKGKEGRVYNKGITADVNSLYPSMMSSESGNIYPVGYPMFWAGNYIPDEALEDNRYFFIRIKTRFYIKKDRLPCIQLKNTLMYTPTQYLETSDIYDEKTDKYYDKYIGFDGDIKDTRVTLTLTMTDYYLILEQYELVDFEILDGCYFDGMIGIFDEYIYKYKQIKMTNTGAIRELAKLFLNNLYGKMASSDKSSFKVAYIKDDNTIGFYGVEEHNKKVGYIPVGSAITSYSRNFTIRAAQANYHGVDMPGFIYADTDSIHCDLSSDELVNVPVDDNDFCHWKLEGTWDEAIFVRQKTYIEHIIEENLNKIIPYYNVKCAGMPERCKNLFIASMTRGELDNLTDEEAEFLFIKRELSDFKLGLCIPGKLLPRRIPGGIILKDTTYQMR